MENQVWPAKYQQSVSTVLERTENTLNNGIQKNGGDDGECSKQPSEEDHKEFIKVEPCQESNPINITISEKCKHAVRNILEQIKSLSQIGKFLLYLKLPSEVSNPVDPFRQPLNPLGNRSEIYRTISWIKTHLEEDPDISLPKQEVYNGYFNYCEANQIKPLSQADFGKVMKQVYPRVRARRLGTRGNSRYCYSGLRRCVKLKAPVLPDLADKPTSTEVPFTQSSLNAAAWQIVKEWSEKQLSHQFPTIQTLAYHLILNHSVGRGTDAASKFSYAAELLTKEECKSENKHREMQIQLQKKIQQKNEGKERKRKVQSSKADQKPGGKKSRSQSLPAPSPSSAVVSTTGSPTASLVGGATTRAITNTNGDCSSASSSSCNSNSTSPTVATQGSRTICDNKSMIESTHLPALPDFNSFQRPAEGLLQGKSGQETNLGVSTAVPVNKVLIPKLHVLSTSAPVQAVSPQVMSSKRPTVATVVVGGKKQTTKYKSQQQPGLRRNCDIAPYNPLTPTSSQAIEESNRSQDFNIGIGNRIKEKLKCNDHIDGDNNVDENKCDRGLCDDDEDEVSDFPLTRERINSVSNVEKDAMDEYLGTTNSQHDEELSKYFSNNEITNSTADSDNTSKISTLRQLLQNGIVDTKPSVQNLIDNKLMTDRASFTNPPSLNCTLVQNKIAYVAPSTEPLNISNVQANVKRRVSFDTSVAEDAVPPSPNTRRKNFSFTPISSGPQSPNNGIQSKCSSTTTSPFVSPRNTPVLRTKPSVHQNAGLLKNVSKVKREIDLSIEIPQESQFQGANFTIMSAPASPMLKKLLNSNSKVSYNPGYNMQSIPTTPDVSQEVTQFFSTNNIAPNLDTNRSQSAPLHPAVGVKNNFPISSNGIFMSDQSSPMNEFAELDPIPEVESDNVKRLLNSLDEQTCDNNNIDLFNIDITSNQNLNEFGLQLIDMPPAFPQNTEQFIPARTVRSQSMDIGTVFERSCNPSRSVPCTPIPFTQNVKIPPKMNYNSSSRSYPSTPLTTEDHFTYNNTNGDYLLNGQPIRTDTLTDSMDFMPSLVINEEAVETLQQERQEFPMMDGDGALIDGCVLIDQNYSGNVE